MPLTPADVHNIAFKKPPIGKRGYDQDEVDAFLDSLEQELTVLIEENNKLRAAVAGGGRAPDRSAADAHLATVRDELMAQLDRARREEATAEHTARAMRAELEQAHRRGGPVVPDEREHPSRVLAMAEHTAGNHLEDAKRAARQLLSDARSTAQQITGEALANADALGQDARRRHQEAVTGADASRAAALQQIDDLDALGREYRSRLRAHVAHQLGDLGAPGTAHV